MKSTQEAIKVLTEDTGMTEDELLKEATFDAVAWSVCMNDGCNFTNQYEPDCDGGWCDECEEGSVQSILIILGVI